MQSFPRTLKCLFSFPVLLTHPVFSRVSQRIFLQLWTLHWEGVWKLICTPTCHSGTLPVLLSELPEDNSWEAGFFGPTLTLCVLHAVHWGNNSAVERRWLFLWISCIQWLGRTPVRAFMLKLGPNQWDLINESSYPGTRPCRMKLLVFLPCSQHCV